LGPLPTIDEYETIIFGDAADFALGGDHRDAAAERGDHLRASILVNLDRHIGRGRQFGVDERRRHCG
jgi:hypothetical protein